MKDLSFVEVLVNALQMDSLSAGTWMVALLLLLLLLLTIGAAAQL